METNPLPGWVRVKQDSRFMMVAGRDFQPGDTLYFNEKAYPRVLWKKLSESSWSVQEDHGGYYKNGRISIEPNSYYVVKPATPRTAKRTAAPGQTEDCFRDRPLRDIRVEGEDLTVGDVVYLDVNRKSALILEIGSVVSTTFRGATRAAKIHLLATDKTVAHIFSGFHVAPPFVVVAGPKFEAAHKNPALVFWREGVNRWHWKGE